MASDVAIDGVVPARVERPETEAAVAELVRETSSVGSWLIPIGGGTAMNGANPVDEVRFALDMSGLEGIIEYEPSDLTVSVHAGTRWSTLQRVLQHEGQALPIDVPFPDEATLGGIVATGYAGPRRLRDGTLKDLLLGASYVRGDGLAAKAGGKVVKNVSGFEIPRLLHGSWGSLAVITSVNLKVVPAHEYEVTLTGEALDTVDACERVLELTRARSATAAAVIDGTLGTATLAIRLTGREEPTRDLAAEILGDARMPWSDRIDGLKASAAWWQDREDRLAAGQAGLVAIEIGCPPSQLADVLSTLRRALPSREAVTVHASPGAGAVALAFDESQVSLDTWWRLWAEHGLARHARFVVIAAPRRWRAERDVWHIEPGARRLMQSLKAAFDPNDALNRGRLWTAPAAAQSIDR